MPVILRFFGYTFYFFSREHEPIHVHIEGADGYAVYDLTDNGFVPRTVNNIKIRDLKKIEIVLEENKETIIQVWNNYSSFASDLSRCSGHF